MGRFLFGVGLLAALLLAGLSVWQAAEEIHTPVSGALEEAAAVAQEGHWEKARGMAEAAKELWEKHWHAAASFSDHAPMDEIDSLFSQIESYSGTELAALCRRIASLVRAVAEAHSLNWWNLL